MTEPIKRKPPAPATLRGDLRFVYRSMGGKQKLLELAKGDEKFFKALITEQLRLELREEEIKASQKPIPAGNTIFMIKGLDRESEKSLSITAVPEEVLRFKSSIFPVESDNADEFIEEEDGDGAE